MRYHLIAAILLILPFWIPGRDQGDVGKSKAPLFDNLGSYHHPVSTASKDAQRYFDQGLTLCFAFNHAEAIRSFEEAARLDPHCAMAYWGIAFAHGTYINKPMSDEAVPKAYAALQKARELAVNANPKEQAYIEALAKRYTDKPQKNRGPLDQAFADAMRDLVKSYPDDLDAATLFAEALMDTMPWNYWTEDGQPKPATEEMLAALEFVLKRQPDHAGACHYLIHAVEASPNPERGLAAAHRLRDLVPGAAHLVHMPSHIFVLVGNYHEASLCNERAIAVEEAYIARYKAKAMHPTHNLHVLSYSTSMEGRGADSIRAARKAAAGLTKMDIERHIKTQWIKALPLLAQVRFGQWDGVLREPRPESDWAYVTAMWHYARGMAFARTLQPAEAQHEAVALDRIAKGKPVDAMEPRDFPSASLMRIARAVLMAEVAGLHGGHEARMKGLEEAVRLQDKLAYMEPPYWYFPIRQLQGAALVETRQFAEAEKIYREDLKRHPDNGWSLFGLIQCLRAQGQTQAAAEAERRFREAWMHADVTLTASCF
jgi:tetratricopeptide (TPR) repeat protein